MDAVLARLAAMHTPGIATDMRTTMGALINRTQYERTLDFIASAKSEGACLATGGRHPPGPHLANGFFVEPTIFTGVTPAMRIAREEVFGPLLSVFRWKTKTNCSPQSTGWNWG